MHITVFHIYAEIWAKVNRNFHSSVKYGKTIVRNHSVIPTDYLRTL